MNNSYKRESIVLGILLFLGLATLGTLFQKLLNRSAIFSSKAMKAKDKDKISALFYWVGVGNIMKESSKRNIDQIAEYPAQKIELLPLPDDFQTEFIRDGLKYIPNIKLVGMFKIIYGDDGPPTFADANIPYGIKDGKYYLPNTIVQPN